MTAPADPRLVALRVLRALDEREAFIQPVLAAEAARARLEPRDRRLALTLVQGVMRWRGRLDHALAAKVSRSWDGTAPVLRDVLRLAAFQLLMLDRVPDYAAVNAAVDEARRHGGQPVARFVNGVLRGLLRAPPGVPAGLDAESMAIRVSHPVWRVEAWIARYGAEAAEALALAHNGDAPLTVRASAGPREALAARLRAEGATVADTRFAPHGLVITDHPAPFEGEAFVEGAFFAQDEASQLVVALLDPQPGERVWETCAAPGGKARAILAAIGDGHLLATDAHPEKAKRLARLLRAAEVRAHDATVALDAQFDRVLVDAPCSGLGVARRHPEIKWRRTPADVAEKAALQRRILAAAASAVRPGGVLVYSVCSDTLAEGPEVLAEFLAARPDFSLDPPQAATWTPPLVDGTLQTRPDLHDADAFFAARLRRRP